MGIQIISMLLVLGHQITVVPSCQEDVRPLLTKGDGRIGDNISELLILRKGLNTVAKTILSLPCSHIGVPTFIRLSACMLEEALDDRTLISWISELE